MSEQGPKSTGSPLYGAQPPHTDAGPSSTVAPPPTGSAEVVPESTNPLFGATPPSASTLPTPTSGRTSTPPRIPTRSARLPLHHPSTLPSYLRRLGYILSIVLGSSAVIAGIWSAVLLPLLHASFSARKALVDQQQDRWSGLLGGLREIRARSVYPPAALVPASEDSTVTQSIDQGITEKEQAESARLVEHESEDERADDSNSDSSDLKPIERLLPLAPVSTLSTALADLLTAFTSTSTTRTSLLSTLESYTSYLHRQLYLRSQPQSFGGRYGLNTLSANLAKAGGGKSPAAWGYDQSEGNDTGLEAAGVKSEEWDAVRKEVRAIKGMLLSRRNFAPVAVETEVR